MNLPGINQIMQADANKYCRDKTEYDFKEIATHKYDYVLIAQIWTRYIAGGNDNLKIDDSDLPSKENSRKALTFALDKALKQITTVGSKPVIISNVYDYFSDKSSQGKSWVSPNKCLFKSIKLHNNNLSSCNIPYQLKLDENRLWLNQLFAEMKKKYPNLLIMDLSSLQCTNNICKTEIDGFPFYRDDDGHITEAAADYLGQEYLKKYNNPFERNNRN